MAVVVRDCRFHVATLSPVWGVIFIVVSIAIIRRGFTVHGHDIERGQHKETFIFNTPLSKTGGPRLPPYLGLPVAGYDAIQADSPVFRLIWT